MKTKPYLIFGQNGALYGVEAASVQEIFFLPELTPIAESPRDIVGVINLRGKILPVMDLNLRFGYHSQEYSLTDSTIVIEWEEFTVGIIVNQVQELEEISTELIKTQLSYGREKANKSHQFLAGIAQVEENIVMLLNSEALIRYSQEESEANNKVSEMPGQKSEATTDGKLVSEDPSYFRELPVFCPNATLQEKAIFRERANNLRRQDGSEDFTISKVPLAVIALSSEYFGLNLEIVREFTEIGKITPIPCTPDYIVGNMNLRGEIVTLIDISTALNIPFVNFRSKAIVVQIVDIVVGIVADEVLDVMYLNTSEITAVPAALHSTNDEYLRGSVPYREKIMAILDLHKMLTKGGLVVDEEV